MKQKAPRVMQMGTFAQSRLSGARRYYSDVGQYRV
jgi:hypothetical protein